MKLANHLLLVFKHKFLVLIYCFKCHLFLSGILHDLSKFSITELKQAKYYRGSGSPISLERSIQGYSKAYLHHKKNKHHLEYWLEFEPHGLNLVRMPYKYIVEMICDMIAAGKIYYKKKWTREQPLSYLNRHFNKYLFFMHPDSLNFIKTVLEYLSNTNLKKTLKPKYLKKVYQDNLKYPEVVVKNLN